MYGICKMWLLTILSQIKTFSYQLYFLFNWTCNIWNNQTDSSVVWKNNSKLVHSEKKSHYWIPTVCKRGPGPIVFTYYANDAPPMIPTNFYPTFLPVCSLCMVRMRWKIHCISYRIHTVEFGLRLSLDIVHCFLKQLIENIVCYIKIIILIY